jgi:ubiquinone/menaquinone biosynthesis C-methylase UbiE
MLSMTIRCPYLPQEGSVLALPRIPRIFWDLYGAEAWDNLNLPSIKRTLLKVVGILGERRASSRERVLDAGCGTGSYSVALAIEGFNVTGVDYSAGMLKRARSKVTPDLSGRLSFHRADLNGPLAFEDASFDHVIGISVLQTVADPGFTLSEFVRVLKPGGTLVVMQVPRPANSPYAAIRQRLRNLDSRKLVVIALTAAKVLLERTRAKYWTPEELLALLLATGQLRVASIDQGPPIVAVATKA